MGADSEVADALAFYFWPARWVGSPPSNDAEGDRLDDVIFESSLPRDLRMKVCRDGMVVWDFTAWGGNPSLRRHYGKGGRIDPEPDIKAQIRCLRLMNAHLACLFQSLPNSLESIQVLTPNHFLKVRFSNCEWLTGNHDDPNGYLLGLARKRPETLDPRWRLSRLVLGIEGLEGADGLLRQLLERESSEMALFRIESIYRSLVAFRSFDHGGVLVNAWVAIEGLLGDLFARYLDTEHKGNGENRIDSDRRRYLEGSSLNSRTTAEILSLVGLLPYRLYREVRTCAKARNSWMHSAAPGAMGSAQAEQAIRVASEMFRLVEGVDFSPPITRHLMSFG